LTELDGDGFEAMMGLFEYLGFRPLVSQGPSYGARPGMASFAQIELIRALSREYTLGSYRRGRAEQMAGMLLQDIVAAVPDRCGRPEGHHGAEGDEGTVPRGVTLRNTAMEGPRGLRCPFS